MSCESRTASADDAPDEQAAASTVQYGTVLVASVDNSFDNRGIKKTPSARADEGGEDRRLGRPGEDQGRHSRHIPYIILSNYRALQIANYTIYNYIYINSDNIRTKVSVLRRGTVVSVVAYGTRMVALHGTTHALQYCGPAFKFSTTTATKSRY